MSKMIIAATAALATAGAASAALTGVSVLETGVDIAGPGTTTYQVFADFDAADDRLLSLNGIGDGPLAWSGAELVNVAGGPFPNRGFFAPAGDSWLTIGEPASEISESPSFPLFGGSDFSTDGAIFDSNPGTPVNPTAGQILIAQITIATGGEGTFSGNLQWFDGNGTESRDGFAVVVPAPGAVALLGLLGLAGLAGGRRRRG